MKRENAALVALAQPAYLADVLERHGMMVVLAVYAAGVYIFVSRNASNSLDTEIRYDYEWAAAMADELPDGSLKWFEEETSFGSNTPWLQVWCSDDTGCGAGSNRGEVIFRHVIIQVARSDCQGDGSAVRCV